ncbi:matrilysin-like [Physella acuta]|uniref:matrilysin-like n=1 Tax=Physella acuta TaxID=109671 RepID=UPI0027DBCD65|nr:matrilysin-like [Physella acuta]XP_059170338.1 matrilysin-like [Physella acuta]
MCVEDANMRCCRLVVCLLVFVYVGGCTGETVHVPRDESTGVLVPGDAIIGEGNVKQKNVSVTRGVEETGDHSSTEVVRKVHSSTEVVRNVGDHSWIENTQQSWTDGLASTTSYDGTGKTQGNDSLSQVFRKPRDTKGVSGVVDSVLNFFAKGKAFLERFGYIEDVLSGATTPVGAIKNALKSFQDFNGLPVTGELDLATVTKMLQPRCGLPDVIKPGSRYASVPSGYRAPGSAEMRAKWPKNDLTYRLVSYTRKLGQGQVDDAIARAFRKWSDVTPLVFRRGQGAVDINIGFTRGDHGDGSPFDRQGNVLAHAFFPGYGEIAGDTHFDDDEDWTVNSPQGVNLEIVAAHEFGHALGLEHSRHKDALMAPF